MPTSGTPAAGFGNDELASISRAVALQRSAARRRHRRGRGPSDQNVELLVDDPRTATVRGTAGNDVIRGTPGDDVILCGPGDDMVITGDGDDVIRCGPGNDMVKRVAAMTA